MKKSVKEISLLAGLMMMSGACAHADTKANYFRVWQGFQRPDLTSKQFKQELSPFMKDTVELYKGRGLSNYIVVVPPDQRPDYVPDEFALVAFNSEESYRTIRNSPEGQVYGDRHWDVFDKNTSASAKQFFNYSVQRPVRLENNAAYDLIGTPIDWASGYTLSFIGTRKNSVSTATFMERLQDHIELARDTMAPLGLRGYIIIANENYEVAYLNWTSKVAHDAAVASVKGKRVFADASAFMDVLMYEAALELSAGSPILAGKTYSTLKAKTREKPRALIVVTSHDQLGSTGKKTGYYLPEVSHPFFELTEGGFDVHIASIKGGKAPVDESSLDMKDARNKEFWETPRYRALLEKTRVLGRVDSKDYDVILFAGGHGTMWDFPNSKDVQRVTAAVYTQGGVVAAVCHGPAALVNVMLPNGQPLVAGRNVTGFSNAEEEAAQLTKVMPFLLEDALVKQGGQFKKADLWKEHVVVDGRLVTGQNPASATGVGKAIVKLFQK